MPLRSVNELRRRAELGVQVCTTHGPNCQKYPDHPVVRERNKPDMELVEMIRTGHSLRMMRELADAGYELPEEFTRGNEDPPKGHRVDEFLERYDLGKHFPSDRLEVPQECKTRKLSDDEIRQRREYADAVRQAHRKNQLPPVAPWNRIDPEEVKRFSKRLSESRAEFRRQREAEKAERVNQLRGDQELGRKMREARETWVNSPPRNRYTAHTQDVREGYGDAVPEFEEME